MKIFLPVMCSLLLIGCNNSTQTSAPATNTETAAPSSTTSEPAPVAETNISSSAEVAALPAVAVDGKALFAQKCAACHGNNGEKSALNKSQIIANFSEQQIKDALHGYQTGTYGKEMKALMQGQVKALNNEEIETLAKYISNL